MALTRERKQELVSEYKEILSQNKAIILTHYQGLTVPQMEALRAQVRESGGNYQVVKNTLVKMAFEDVGLPQPEGGLDGPTAIGATSDDLPGLAKAIVDLSKEVDVFHVKSAIIDGEVFDAAEIVRLAELPPLPVLRAQLLGLVQTPARNIAGVLAGSMRQVVNVLNAYSEQEAAA
ncbi:MAG: 50S ribosomal protein L10 [Anaerolineales bacterium]